MDSGGCLRTPVRLLRKPSVVGSNPTFGSMSFPQNEQGAVRPASDATSIDAIPLAEHDLTRGVNDLEVRCEAGDEPKWKDDLHSAFAGAVHEPRHTRVVGVAGK